jgi:hypothetical protein
MENFASRKVSEIVTFRVFKCALGVQSPKLELDVLLMFSPIQLRTRRVVALPSATTVATTLGTTTTATATATTTIASTNSNNSSSSSSNIVVNSAEEAATIAKRLQLRRHRSVESLVDDDAHRNKRSRGASTHHDGGGANGAPTLASSAMAPFAASSASDASSASAAAVATSVALRSGATSLGATRLNVPATTLETSTSEENFQHSDAQEDVAVQLHRLLLNISKRRERAAALLDDDVDADDNDSVASSTCSTPHERLLALAGRLKSTQKSSVRTRKCIFPCFFACCAQFFLLVFSYAHRSLRRHCSGLQTRLAQEHENARKYAVPPLLPTSPRRHLKLSPPKRDSTAAPIARAVAADAAKLDAHALGGTKALDSESFLTAPSSPRHALRVTSSSSASSSTNLISRPSTAFSLHGTDLSTPALNTATTTAATSPSSSARVASTLSVAASATTTSTAALTASHQHNNRYNNIVTSNATSASTSTTITTAAAANPSNNNSNVAVFVVPSPMPGAASSTSGASSGGGGGGGGGGTSANTYQCVTRNRLRQIQRRQQQVIDFGALPSPVRRRILEYVRGAPNAAAVCWLWSRVCSADSQLGVNVIARIFFVWRFACCQM